MDIERQKSPLPKATPRAEPSPMRPSNPAPPSQELAQAYTVADDLRIIELFQNRQPSDVSGFAAQRDALAKELRRSAENLRDRFRRYLRYVTEEDIANIKSTVGDNPTGYFLHFEKAADEKDKEKKKLKSISTEEARPIVPTKFKAGGAKAQKKAAAKAEARASQDVRSKENILKRPSGESHKAASPKKVSFHGHGMYDFRQHVPREYVQSSRLVRLEDVEVAPSIRNETQSLSENLRSYLDCVGITIDRGNFNFEFVKKNSVKDVSGILGSVCMLMGITLEEAEQIYEGVSFDVKDLKAYIGGNKRLLWTSVEDQALINALSDSKAMQKFYPILVAEKGEDSVQKRTQFLRDRQLLKATPRYF